MKTMKKLASVLLALVMVMALAAPAFASGASDKHTITIEKALPGNTYNAYKILELESFSEGHQSYKIAEGWADFFAPAGAGWNTLEGAGEDKADLSGYVNWKGPAANTPELAAFAKAALEYAKNHTATVKIAGSVDSSERTDTNYATTETVEISVSGLGWYLVDSSNGALCSLNTTTPNATIEEKNPAPSIEKTWDNDDHEKKIGDPVNFTIKVTAQKGAQDYVVHDKMGAGLDLVASTITVDSPAEAAAAATIETSGFEDDCTFEISFSKEYLDTITAATEITITYTATINANAVTASIGNKAHLEYGDNKVTPDSTIGTNPDDPDPTPEVYNISILKYDGGKYTADATDKEALPGAEFKLYSNEDCTVEIPLTYIAATGETPAYYRPALGSETVNVVEAGEATIKGLGNGTYYLKETKAPAGYNALTAPETVTIENGVAVTKHIANNTGAQLPSTGGIGTTIFYVGGGILIAAAGILLITKKRMGKAD